jgi:hypothetical protein
MTYTLSSWGREAEAASRPGLEESVSGEEEVEEEDEVEMKEECDRRDEEENDEVGGRG